ncbi:hypothetical protein [Celeribacter naphthalenivorans]|uniref:hypothetical protein n=1 Tax=Celeribacter naphthalenivorans TaxID=1614694 RepID=UPI001CFB1BFA|nr:hypothetical protein [Celeribacter naphthalenivorans]
MMTMTLKILSRGACAALFFWAPAARAENPAPVLYCSLENGCARGAAQISETDAGVLFGQEVTPGQVSIVYVKGQKAAALSKLAPEKVNEMFGGQEPMPRLLFLPNDVGHVTDPIPVFAPGTDGQEMVISLFPDDDAGIVPRDGLWRVASRDQTFSNCPAQMEAMFRSSGQLDAQNETRRFDWGGKFDPEAFDFMNGEGQRIDWHRTGPNSFEGELFAVASGPAEVAADVGAEILTPTRIDAHVDLFIGAMMGAEALASMGLSDCKVFMTFDIEHTAD